MSEGDVPLAEPQPPKPPAEAAAAIDIHAPSQRNRKLARFLANANGDTRLKARWIAQQVTADRLGMNDHVPAPGMCAKALVEMSSIAATLPQNIWRLPAGK